MKKINKIGENTLFKIVGITVILYLFLFSDKNPNAIGHKLSKQDVTEGYHTAKEKYKFISEKLEEAKEFEKEKKNSESANNSDSSETKAPEPYQYNQHPNSAYVANIPKYEIKIDEKNFVKVTDKNYKISCGDMVEISYYMVANKQKIGEEQKQKFIVGSNSNYLIEQDIIGSKKGDTIDIDFMKRMSDKADVQDTKILYRTKILSVKKAVKPQYKCNNTTK